MKQAQYSPLTNAEIVCLIYAGTNGFLDKVEVKQIGSFEIGLLAHLRSKHASLLHHITKDDPKIKGEVEDKIRAALNEYAADFA
jgi:F-type H+-transporting ATPase subunit alpha